MRSRIFCKKFKSLLLIALSAFLLLPSLLNSSSFSSPASAVQVVNVDGGGGGSSSSTSCADCFYVVVSGGNGSEIVRYGIKAQNGDEVVGQLNLFYRPTIRATDDCSLNVWCSAEDGKAAQILQSGNEFKISLFVQLGTDSKANVVVEDKSITLSQATGIVVRIVDSNGNTVSGAQNSLVDDGMGNLNWSTGTAMTTAKVTTVVDDQGNSQTAYDTTSSSGSGVSEKTVTQEDVDSGKVEEDLNIQTHDDSGSGTTTTDNNTEEATCHSKSGAVGWFVCPILELAANASKWAYDTVIEPSLRIRSDLFSTTGDNTGTFQAWSVFRDVANVIFVILLLIVILSQLTGVGIDNYGIKKTLPNLIVAAILVNLSFIICQALVDVSNIVGAGTYNAIESISSGITVPNLGPVGEIAYTTSIIFTICAAAAGIGVTAAVTGGFWTMVSGALLAVLPVIIGAVVAILFLFFLLAMRQAIVVMLVAVAPLAFVCYTLPNTKRLFSRWSELLRAMLVLYPICAIMIAGGRLASKIILASGAAEDNLFIILVAMVAEAGPLFLIPGLTRNAYRATGQLGTTLNGLRTRWTGGARNRVRNSQTYQNAQARNQRRRITSGVNLRRVNRYNEAQERLQAGSGSYAPGFRGRARRARDYFTTRAGNTERVASINEQVLAAEEQQRKINRMSNAEQVEGMRQQANIAAQQQNVRNADYANAQFANAVITQAQVEHEASHDRQMNYNNERYVRGKRNANLLALENEFYDTRMTADADIVQGKRQQAHISRDATRQNVRHYNDATYQQAAAASLARKERDDNIRSRESLLANGGFTLNGNTVNGFDTGQVREALQHALSNSYTGDNREADINALVNTLATQGDAGRSAVYEALQYAENNGGINNEARQQLSQNIMQYHAADFKNNQRSVFDYARANTGVNPGQVRTNNGTDERDSTFADFNAKAANSLTQEQLVSMDEAELMRYLNTLRGRDNNGAVVTNRFNREEGFANHTDYVAAEQAAQQQVQDLAMQTLTNQDALQRLKGSQRAILEKIATLPTSSRATP